MFLVNGDLEWITSDDDGKHIEGIRIEFRIYSPDSKRDALNQLATYLNRSGVNWLHPIRSVTDKWLLNLDEVRVNFDNIKDLEWARGMVEVIPDYDEHEKQSILIGAQKGSRKSYHANIQFVITPQEMELTMGWVDFPELKPFLEKFRAEHQKPGKCGFLVMRFDSTRLHEDILVAIKSTCANYGIEALRADDRTYSEDLLPNVRTYMHGCGFGIAVYERLVADDFNPNVSLEVGYMMALGKPVLLLKDKTLRSLQTDLVGRLYETFDSQSPNETIPPVLEKWLKDKSFIQF